MLFEASARFIRKTPLALVLQQFVIQYNFFFQNNPP
jgi:hypothetical protein